MRGRTTIVIAHRPGTIALADTVLLLDDGRVGARGTHDELLATNSRYRDVLAAWAAHDELDLDAEIERDLDAEMEAEGRTRFIEAGDDTEAGATRHEPIGGE